VTASTTDYWTAKALGPVGMLAVEALRRRALDQELAERPAEQLERTKPEPQWVKDLRERIETNRQNPRVTVRGTVIAEGEAVERPHDRLPPDRTATFEIRVGRACGAAARSPADPRVPRHQVVQLR
jgi:hypothetical protein